MRDGRYGNHGKDRKHDPILPMIPILPISSRRSTQTLVGNELPAESIAEDIWLADSKASRLSQRRRTRNRNAMLSARKPARTKRSSWKGSARVLSSPAAASV